MSPYMNCPLCNASLNKENPINFQLQEVASENEARSTARAVTKLREERRKLRRSLERSRTREDSLNRTEREVDNIVSKVKKMVVGDDFISLQAVELDGYSNNLKELGQDVQSDHSYARFDEEQTYLRRSFASEEEYVRKVKIIMI